MNNYIFKHPNCKTLDSKKFGYQGLMWILTYKRHLYTYNLGYIWTYFGNSFQAFMDT